MSFLNTKINLNNKTNIKALIVITLIFLLSSCATTSTNKVDTGDLTRQEMETTAQNMAIKMAEYFRSEGNGKIQDIFVALLYTRNETSSIIDTDIFDYALVEAMKNQGIFTIRPEDRKAAIEEMKFNLTGLAEDSLSLGMMKSPNYFIKTIITESSHNENNSRIIEQIIRIELREVETQLVVWSHSNSFTKKLKGRNNNVAW